MHAIRAGAVRILVLQAILLTGLSASRAQAAAQPFKVLALYNGTWDAAHANFGHHAMDYDTNTILSSTFASETQNRFLLDGLKWLGGAASSHLPAHS